MKNIVLIATVAYLAGYATFQPSQATFKDIEWLLANDSNRVIALVALIGIPLAIVGWILTPIIRKWVDRWIP